MLRPEHNLEYSFNSDATDGGILPPIHWKYFVYWEWGQFTEKLDRLTNPIVPNVNPFAQSPQLIVFINKWGSPIV